MCITTIHKKRCDNVCIVAYYCIGDAGKLNVSVANPHRHIPIRVGVKYSTCTWYLYLSTYLSVLDVLEYLVYGNAKVLVLVLVLDQKVLGTYK